MKILQVNNIHRIRGGADVVAELTTDILKSKGHEVIVSSRDSGELEGIRGKLKAFFLSLYSPWGWRAIKSAIQQHKPEVVHVHEFYPFFSPWIFQACQMAGVPVVMTCHDFRIICPIGSCLRDGRICEMCREKSDLWCVLNNCRDNIFESLSYAMRHFLVQKLKLYHKNITLFITLTEFAQKKLVRYGFPEERFAVVGNPATINNSNIPRSPGQYFAYVGRLSKEKGVDVLLDAGRMTGLPVRIAGDHAACTDMVKEAPTNAEFVGFLKQDQLAQFYENTRCLVLPSTCYEMFPLVLLEAMSFRVPVIAANIGGIPEIIEDGKSGLLFEPGNAEDLARKMQYLWENPGLGREIGQKGWERAKQKYHTDVYYSQLIAAYKKAINLNKLKNYYLN
jgi:glycosyltransferase involved in cell wall biosynthesis